MEDIHITTATSICEIDSIAWDQLNKERPFQSHRWFEFGERVMEDCQPTYLLAHAGGTLAARACLWLTRNEPLPRLLGASRQIVKAFINRWPLLICRSPIANTTGLILPAEDSLRSEILPTIAQAAVTTAVNKRASFVVFDYLAEDGAKGWPESYRTVKFSDPGTIMKNQWESLDDYLSASTNKKNRRQYKRTMREIEAQGVRLSQHRKVVDIEAAMRLIRNVELRHGALPNPWTRTLLENIEQINGIWLDARIGERLTGCMLLLEDNGTQLATALGLADNVSHVYFSLLFASLEVGLKNKVHQFRWGSGAYEAKRRLGFQLESNNLVAVRGTNWLLQRLVHSFIRG